MHELIITGGTIVDGTGQSAFTVMVYDLPAGMPVSCRRLKAMWLRWSAAKWCRKTARPQEPALGRW